MQLVQTIRTHSVKLSTTPLPQLWHQLWKETQTVQEQEETLHCSLHPRTEEEVQTTKLTPTQHSHSRQWITCR